MASDRFAALMKAVIHHDPMIDSVAVAAADLDLAQRVELATKLRSRQALRVAPSIYAVRHPVVDEFTRVFGGAGTADVSVPAAHLVAAALCRQHGWRLAMPVDFAKFLLGLADRPEQLTTIPYDQPVSRSYPAATLTLVPASASLFDLTPAGQALTQGLLKDASEIGLLRIALEAAQGLLGEAVFRKELHADIDAGRLGEREYLVARAIVTADSGPKPIRRAPPSFEPPPHGAVRLDGWWTITASDGSECLGARHVTGHPYAGKEGRGIMTSPLVWIDEGLGWAKTQSRVYRLGLKVVQPLESGKWIRDGCALGGMDRSADGGARRRRVFSQWRWLLRWRHERHRHRRSHHHRSGRHAHHRRRPLTSPCRC